MSGKIDLNLYWMPWEHKVCVQCCESNPYAIRLVKVGCFYPYRSEHSERMMVVIDHEHMKMVAIRPMAYSYFWIRRQFVFCRGGEPGFVCVGLEKCWFAHSQIELNTWNIKRRVAKVNKAQVAEVCTINPRSQSPTQVCLTCFTSNPRALWLSWLVCTNEEEHESHPRVTVIAEYSTKSRKLVKVRPVPATITRLSEVILCERSVCLDSCSQAHSMEERDYWLWELASRVYSQDQLYDHLSKKYQFPDKSSTSLLEGLECELTTENYKSKYHKLVYLEEMEQSRKMIKECDNSNVEIEIDHSSGKVCLKGLTYSAMDYASHKRADVMLDLHLRNQQIQSYTLGIQDVDYDRDALVLKSFGSSLYQFRNGTAIQQVSAHFNISHHYYKRLHEAIEYANSDVLCKLIPSIPTRSYHLGRRKAQAVCGRNVQGFRLDGKYQLTALRQMFTSNPEAPYLLLGPFGTGKTYVLAAAVTKLLESYGNRVLVCTHLNRGADGLYKNLHKHARSILHKAVRMVPSQEAASNLRLVENASVAIATDIVQSPAHVHELSKWSVIVTTFVTALHLAEPVKQGHLSFTHILIDEGAQCPEPEALGALVLASRETKIMIVGDNKQVGPKAHVLDKTARDKGLGSSLLERLFTHYEGLGQMTQSHTATLLTNYRCHPSILMLASSLFYECTLLSRVNRETHPKAPYPLVFDCTSIECDQKSFSNCPAENRMEADILIKKLINFIQTWPKPPNKPIGLLASTKQQVACLRHKWWQMKRRFKVSNTCQVEIMPTYNIQGEEFSAVFLSTAEPTDENGAPCDPIRSICNEYVFNTVITRAQSLIYVAGNPFKLQHMANNFKTNCWTEYIRRCVQCHSLVLPEAHTLQEIERLPNIARQLSEQVLLNLIIDQSTQLDEDDTDLIVQRYISDLNERREFKIACTLVQGPTGELQWVDEDEVKGQQNGIFVWCKLDCKNFHSATAIPTGSSDCEKIQLNSVASRKGAFHGDVVKVDTIKKCVLFDEDTEDALAHTKFGMSFLCRVDPRNPILFFPLDRRHPKFVNLPIISCRTQSVVCFDPSSIGPNSTSLKVSDLIPHECAIKMLFVVKFLGWKKKNSYPMGIIVGALPACRSPYIGDLVLRVANGIPLAPCNLACDPPTQEYHVLSRVFQDAFTIDPQGCTDHDDALTCKPVLMNKVGTVYEMGVHIINVQKHVPKDGELDKAASERGCAAYRSSDNCISPMLPHAMIQDRLSISAGVPRDTISVLARFTLKNGKAELISDVATIVESQLTSALDLSYEEAQKVICDELEFPDDPTFTKKLDGYNRRHNSLSIEKRIHLLWKLAIALRKRRLGEWEAYCFHLDDPEKLKCPEAHYLVEELMIWANTQVAGKLLKTFPDRTIVRVQDPPSSEEMVKLLGKHGGIMAASLGLRACAPEAQQPVHQLQILQSTCDEIKRLLGQGLVRDTLHQVQFESIHPQTAVAIIAHRRSHSHTDYVISERGKLEYPHDTLKCQHYTHFTSPIRRYIDIVIQRLIHAAINNLPCPYTQEELKRVCISMKNALKQSNNYEREISKFDLAMELYSSSEVFTGFIFEITDDAELDILFPEPRMKVLYARERKIPLKHLNAFRIPSMEEQRSIATAATGNAGRERVVLTPENSYNTPFTWKVKVSSFSGSAQKFFENSNFEVLPDSALLGDCESYADISLFVADDGPSRTSCLHEHKLKVRVKPFTQTIPHENWKRAQELLPLDLSEEDSDDLSERLWSIPVFNVSGRSPLGPSVPASLSKQCRAHCPLWIYKLHRPVRMYEVLQVQLSASPLEYILSPCVQLVEMGPDVRICVQHNNNPAECFCDKLTRSASKQRYSSIDDYFLGWEKVLLAEAAIGSIQDSDLMLIKDVVMKWPKLDADINSAGQVSYKLHIPSNTKEAGVRMDLPDDFVKMSYEFFKFNFGDLACVRYSITDRDGKTTRAVFHMVVHHVNVSWDKVDDEINVKHATVYLKFVGDTSNYISPAMAKLLSNGPHHDRLEVSCEVQLIPLTLPFRRVYRSLHNFELENSHTDLALQILLGRANTRKLANPNSVKELLTYDQTILATSMWPIQRRNTLSGNGVWSGKAKLNGFQRKAIDIATSNKFTLIQGPPGTGKSVTGAHLAFALAVKLKSERASAPTSDTRPSSGASRKGVQIKARKPCVMYCGPSNQAVNVVLDIFIKKAPSEVRDQIKILRVFSKTIEQKNYPGPKAHAEVFRRGSTDTKCEEHHKPYALHELIRKANPKIAQLDRQFENLHAQNQIPSQAMREKYQGVIFTTELDILGSGVDLVLCTCNEASSHRIAKSLKPVYCIIDECAMATEPECMVPIHDSEHVVLIGDHKQLRPVIQNRDAEACGLGTSLFERYVMEEEERPKLQEPFMLEVQYRMHPEICKFPSKEFYERKLKSDHSLSFRKDPEAHLNFWPKGKGKPFVFCDIIGKEGGSHTGQKGKTRVGLESKFNREEAAKIAEIAHVLITQHRVAIQQLAILTPYSAQKERITRELAKKSLHNMTVKTITESQGSEYGIVLLSMVRSKPVKDLSTDRGENKRADIGWLRSNLGFVTDRHQICVGITRCKFGLVIVGNKKLLSYDETWRKLIRHYEEHSCVIRAQDFP